MSPNIANEAVTPPVVGLTGTDIKGNPANLIFLTAADVLAICIRENSPSCILAPPEIATTTAGTLCSMALSKAAVIFSPTTEPILPPIKLKSIQAILTFSPLISPRPLITPSFIPESRSAFSYFSVYSGKSIGFPAVRLESSSLNVPSSIKSSILSLALILK